MKLTLSQDWTFATGIKPEKGVYKCQGKKLEVSAAKMFQNKLFSVKVPTGTYNVALTNHNGEVWLVLIGAGRRRKNIAVGVILSILMQYKSHGVSLTNDDGSPVDESPNDEIHVLWGDGNTQQPAIIHDSGYRGGARVHAWFSKKHAQMTAPALYQSEAGEPLLVTSCSEDYLWNLK
jgi:hypothetical protein